MRLAYASASSRTRCSSRISAGAPSSKRIVTVAWFKRMHCSIEPHSTGGGSRARIHAQPRARRRGDRRGASRAGTGLPGEAGPADRALPGGRRNRLLRAHGVHEDVGFARAAGGGRKSSRRRHGDRGKRGGEERAGRLHAAAGRRRDVCLQSDAVQEAFLRPGEGLRAGEPHRAFRADPRGNPCDADRSVKEFVDAAKRSPGNIDYGAPGPGSPIHLAMEFFKQRADIIMTPIPYKGGADAMTDLIGGRISAMFPDIASALPQIPGGRLRALAVASDKRVAALPELPSIGESGYPGFEAWAWQGFVAPAGTPRAVVMKLNAEFARVMADPTIRQRLSESGFEPRTSTPEEFGAYLKSEIAKWAKVIRESRISLD